MSTLFVLSPGYGSDFAVRNIEEFVKIFNLHYGFILTLSTCYNVIKLTQKLSIINLNYRFTEKNIPEDR